MAALGPRLRGVATGSSRALTALAIGPRLRRQDDPRLGVLALAGALGAAGSVGAFFGHPRPARTEDIAEYEHTPILGMRFSQIPRERPREELAQLAWAVKNLEVGAVAAALRRNPRSAALSDEEGNTLFHLAAGEPAYAARPGEAAHVAEMLLSNGWEVVDQKNRRGERADVVAALEPLKTLLSRRSLDFHEPLRLEQPLALVGQQSPESWRWEYIIQDDKRRSYAGVLRRAVPEERCRAWMAEALASKDWISSPDVPRKVTWYVSKDCADCPYRYSGLEYPATVFPPWMEELRAEVGRLCGLSPADFPNSCNVNVYEDHTGTVGWHSDDELYFQSLTGDTRILSFSLGVARDFCWRLQGTTTTLGCTPLGDGDIMTMEGLFQKHYKHSVPASAEADVVSGKRLNFTFRWIKAKVHHHDAGVRAATASGAPSAEETAEVEVESAGPRVRSAPTLKVRPERTQTAPFSGQRSAL